MIKIHSRTEYKKNKKLSSWGINDPLKKHRLARINANVTGNKMATIREQAKETVSLETKNIVDLKEVSTEMDILHKEVPNDDPEKSFSYDYIVVDTEEYRVPKTVLLQLKAQLESKKDSTKFKVTKSGEGKKTSYTVIMLD